MPEPNEKLVQFPQESSRDVLTEVLHRGAQQMLLTAIEAEVDDYLAARAATVDAAGRRRVVRNGHLPTRAIQTPLGDVRVLRIPLKLNTDSADGERGFRRR